jgi:hypothetical protein
MERVRKTNSFTEGFIFWSKLQPIYVQDTKDARTQTKIKPSNLSLLLSFA